MKKLALLTTMIICCTIATWAQNAISFTIYPDASGEFTIYYSTNSTPSTNAVQVDWGSGLEIYNDKAETGFDPKQKITGTATLGTPIKIYSDCIEALQIVSKAKFIRCEPNNPKLRYIYYFGGNLSPENLEALYMSLYDRSGKDWGELHLSDQDNVKFAGNNILKSNTFITLEKKWYVCSLKAWKSNFSERTHWSLTDGVAKTNLIPAIILQTPGIADITDLQIGMKDSPELPWAVSKSLIRIYDGGWKKEEVSRYTTNADFVSGAPKITLSGTGVTETILIYGAMVSHIKSNTIRSLDLTNATNLRYLSITNCNFLTSIPGLSSQKNMDELQLSGNAYLTDIDAQGSARLKILNASGCTRLKTLLFNRTSLEILNFSRCTSLPYMGLGSLKASKLIAIYASNLGWDACTMDLLYGNLKSPAPSTAFIEVDDMNDTEFHNDFGGSDKTIATVKGWSVYQKNFSTYIRLTGDGGGCNPSGISEEEADKYVTIYPNPATDVVNITLVPNLNAESLQVIDFTGKTVFTMPVSPSKSEYQINVSNYSKGVYLIRVGSITHKMLVK